MVDVLMTNQESSMNNHKNQTMANTQSASKAAWELAQKALENISSNGVEKPNKQNPLAQDLHPVRNGYNYETPNESQSSYNGMQSYSNGGGGYGYPGMQYGYPYQTPPNQFSPGYPPYRFPPPPYGYPPGYGPPIRSPYNGTPQRSPYNGPPLRNPYDGYNSQNNYNGYYAFQQSPSNPYDYQQPPPPIPQPYQDFSADINTEQVQPAIPNDEEYNPHDVAEDETFQKPKSWADAVKKSKILGTKPDKIITIKKPIQFTQQWNNRTSYPVAENNNIPFENSENISPKQPMKRISTDEEQLGPNNKHTRIEQPEPNMQSKKEWPADMKTWVMHSFEQCEGEREKDRMEKYLGTFCQRVLDDGSAWTMNWRLKPLCQVGVKKRKASRNSTHGKNKSRSRSPSPGRRTRGKDSSSSEDTATPIKSNLKSRVGKKAQKSLKGLSSPFDSVDDPQSSKKKIDRAARFHSVVNKKYAARMDSPTQDSNDLEEYDIDYHITGTSTDLVKPYLRLTSAPDPSTVRPQAVLERSVEHVKEKWKANHDYHFACEQMKSIRQDLTVQGIKNEFSVKVYECHARIALEKGDREEFNQCQTNLKSLYAQGISGEVAEFTAYNILYYVYTKSTSDLNSCLATLSKELKKDDVVHFALAIRSATALCNYHTFFKLYASAPKMSGYLIDLFINRQRTDALRRILKTYRPHIEVSFVTQHLAFKEDAECLEWLKELNIVFVENQQSKIDCKASSSLLP